MLQRSADGSTVVTSTSSGFVGLTSKAGTKTGATLNYFDTFLLRTFAMLPGMLYDHNELNMMEFLIQTKALSQSCWILGNL